MNNSDDAPVHVTLVKYESGLGRPGIMAPRVSSTVEITTGGSGGRVVKRSYENGRPGSVQEGDLATDSAATVLALVDRLCALPAQATPGGPDIFGANTAVAVRRGREPVWGYNPGGGGCVVAAPTDDQIQHQLAVTDSHRTAFVDIISHIYRASEASL
ncbi:hypothetical protein H4R18_001686 [Coemansia javaensis]|uniref:Uncharacterized protein n=1 Tax=Coemansia javaensis TaxID=2761396 RepID=A0A9W8HD15_9FUNG|nr:hypothetical protein H4R18_001686 [Coemansia javaensis]